MQNRWQRLCIQVFRHHFHYERSCEITMHTYMYHLCTSTITQTDIAAANGYLCKSVENQPNGIERLLSTWFESRSVGTAKSIVNWIGNYWILRICRLGRRSTRLKISEWTRVFYHPICHCVVKSETEHRGHVPTSSPINYFIERRKRVALSTITVEQPGRAKVGETAVYNSTIKDACRPTKEVHVQPVPERSSR